jgi:hypothetical protein
MSKPSRCQACRREFVPERHNRHRQKYCTDPGCAAKRARQRKRAYYKKRYCCDREFQSRERVRCLEAARRRAQAPPVPPPSPPPPMHEVLAGLVSQMMGTDDPVEIAR